MQFDTQPRSFPGSSAYALGQKVRNEFLSWRQSAKDGLRKIPEKLWQEAIELAAATTVNQVARLLGLEYTEVQRRFIAVYGNDHPAFPHRMQRQKALPKTVDHSGAPHQKSDRKDSHKPQTALFSPSHGFVEASPPLQTWTRPPLLAEIQTPNGMLLRLFSPETLPLLRELLKP